MATEQRKHRVAIVVLCEADGVDEGDASDMAALAIRQAITAGGMRMPRTIDVVGKGGDVLGHATIHAIWDAGVAAGNGYLWLRPTSKGFRDV